MGNACCCGCVPNRRRPPLSESQHGYPSSRGRGYPHGRDPDYTGNTARTQQPIRSGSLLGGKSGNRIYSRYGKYGRNGTAPGGRSTNYTTNTSSPLGKAGGERGMGEGGIDNLGAEYHEDIAPGQRYTNGPPENPPAVHRMRRKNLGAPKVPGRTKHGRGKSNRGGGRASENTRQEESSYALEQGYTNTGYDSEMDELQDIQPLEPRPAGVRVQVVSVESLGPGGRAGRQEGADRTYSVATTVMAGDLEDRKGTPQRVQVSVEVDGRRWIVHRTVADFRALERVLARQGGFSLPSSPLRIGGPLTPLHLNKFLRLVLQDPSMGQLPTVQEFIELGRMRSLASINSSEASCLSADSSNSNNSSNSSNTNSSNSNISTDSSNTNTLSASITNSGTNININIAYEEGAGEIYTEPAPFSSNTDDGDTNNRNADNINNNNVNNLNNINSMSDAANNNKNVTNNITKNTVANSIAGGLTDDEVRSKTNYKSSGHTSIPIFLTPPPPSIHGSTPSTPVPNLPVSASPLPSKQHHQLQIERTAAATPPPAHSRDVFSRTTGQRASLTPEGRSRGGTPINPGLMMHSGVAQHLRRRHSSINLDNLSGPQMQMSPDDFNFLGVIGKGSFGQVLLARHKASGRPFAVKMLSKRMIARRKETQHVLSERSVLIKVLNHPYLVQLHFAFTTNNSIFLVLDYVNGGELFFHLQRERVFSEPRAMFYAAEMCCALSYMHTKGIVYRDLKPENLLLDKDGHVVLTDFGLCKEGLQTSSSRTGTFCGTPEYLAPEILLKKPYTRVVDWWTLGAVLYEMLYGLPPFYSKNQMQMYEAIINKPLKLRQTSTQRARSILSALLKKAPEDRLGSGPEDGEAVKSHEFFRPVDWTLVERRKMKPPFVPKVTGDTDTRNIDPSFTKEPVRLGSLNTSPGGSRVGTGGPSSSGSVLQMDNFFHGFNYVRPTSDGEANDLPVR